MKLFIRYLRERIGVILLLAGIFAVLFVSFSLFRLPPVAVLYPLGLCVILICVFLAADYLRFSRRHKMLSDYGGAETELPEAVTMEGEDYRRIALASQDLRRAEKTDSEARMNAMSDYYTLWAHQIKTPIAAMRLRFQEQDTGEARSTLADLGRIERYVEMALTYLRLEGDGTDYVIRNCDLDAILQSVFKEFAGEFISRRLKLDYRPTSASVLTDEKWLRFVIGQILSNALKYTPSGTISVFLEEPGVLCIRDTGIGIPPEDLPRIFERSYTGLAGRADWRASGIGLYLCKRICDNLGHSISVSSQIGEGTAVRIDLSSKDLPIS